MFFLLRACLWIGAIILLVPMLPQMQTGEAPESAPAQAPTHAPAPAASPPQAPNAVGVTSSPPLAAAPSTVAPAVDAGPALPAAVDVVRFCLNNGAVCEAGFSVVTALGDAVGQGLELAASLQNGEAAPTPSPAYDPPPIAVATVPVRVSALPAAVVGTLTAADRADPWLGDAATAAVTDAATAAASAAATSAASAIGLTVPLPVPDPRRRTGG